MRSDRLARALLRLYPRAWRTRYGDEFLALVAESGLSWLAAADVVAAAGAERLRAVAALARYEDDPTAPLLLPWSRPIREVVAEAAAFMALVGLTVWALSTMGVHKPPWWTWYFFFSQWSNNQGPAVTPASWSERALASFFWFAAATSLTGLGWLAGGMLSRLGFPTPTDRMFESIIWTWFACAGFRMLYCLVRMMSLGSTWPGMHRREIQAWNVAAFLVIVVWALVDLAGESFWSLAMIFFMTLRPFFGFTRAGAARRRARHEAIFGAISAGLHPPAQT